MTRANCPEFPDSSTGGCASGQARDRTLQSGRRHFSFRIWATQRLREYLVNGYSINQQHFEQNAAALEQALLRIKRTAQSPELRTEMSRAII